MTRKIITFAVLGVSISMLLSGCGEKKSRTAPSSRNQLVIRLFQSLDEKEYAAATEQARKLRALDPGNPYFDVIITRQQSNICTVKAQKQLDSGDYKGALETLEKGVKEFPLSQQLKEAHAKVLKLHRADMAIKTYARADGFNARAKAMQKMESAVKALNVPELNAAAEVKRKALAAELDAKQKAEAAAKEAAEKAAALKTGEAEKK